MTNDETCSDVFAHIEDQMRSTCAMGQVCFSLQVTTAETDLQQTVTRRSCNGTVLTCADRQNHTAHCLHSHCAATAQSSSSKIDKRETPSFHTLRTRPGQDRGSTPSFVSPWIIMTMCTNQQGDVIKPPLLENVGCASFLLPFPLGTTSVIVGVATANVRSTNQIQLTALIPSMTDVTIVFSTTIRLYITNDHNPISISVGNSARTSNFMSFVTCAPHPWSISKTRIARVR